LLGAFLDTRPALHPDTQVVIEHQPNRVGSATTKSTMVGHQLLYHYRAQPLALVNPKLKNNLQVSPELSYEKFLANSTRKDRASAVYAARKKHTRESLLYLAKLFGFEASIAHVKKTYMDDLADSTLQVIAWMKSQKMFA
jgi:hypothetical protein